MDHETEEVHELNLLTESEADTGGQGDEYPVGESNYSFYYCNTYFSLGPFCLISISLFLLVKWKLKKSAGFSALTCLHWLFREQPLELRALASVQGWEC